MQNANNDLSPELQAFASLLDAEPPEVQGAFQFLLAIAMHEAGKFELLNVVEVDGQWHYTFSGAGEVFSVVRPEMDKEIERRVREGRSAGDTSERRVKLKNCKDCSVERLTETRKIEASERAERVWPPASPDREPTGYDDAVAYLSDEDRLDSEDETKSLRKLSAKPELYEKGAVRERLARTLARLPRDFFALLRSGKRNVYFYATPGNALTGYTTETHPIGPAISRIYIICLKKDVIETDDTQFFDGVVLHELCHVVLDHPGSPAWPEEPQERRLLVRGFENEAIELALEIGFEDKTRRYVDRSALEAGWDEDELHSIQEVFERLGKPPPFWAADLAATCREKRHRGEIVQGGHRQ